MKEKGLHKKRIAIVRGLGPRITQAEFASSFRKFRPRFITAGADKNLLLYLKRKGIDYHNLEQRYIYGFDPIKFLTGKITHRSWVGVDFRKFLEVCDDCDLIETYEAFHFFSAQSAKVAALKGKSLICEIWTSFFHPSYFVPPYSFNVRRVMKQTDLFILRSERARNFLKPYNIEKSKVKVIYHGVNVERFTPGEKNWEGIRILFVGTINNDKGIMQLLRAFSLLDKDYPKKLELVIVGRGVWENMVKKTAESLPIKYLGHVSHVDIPEVYRQCDIFCGPSNDYKYFGIFPGSEMFGYVFMEAMASGLPIVTTRCGTIPEVVGVDNEIVEQKDVQGLYKALKRLIDDKDKRYELGKANRRRAEKIFDLKKQTAILEQELLKIM